MQFDFPSLDADRDGRGTSAELRAYCRGQGFTPVVIVVAPPAPEDHRLAELWRLHLDADGDKRYSAAELRRSPQLLRRYDLNEDEFLDLQELAEAQIQAPAPPDEAGVKIEYAAASDAHVLKIELGGQAPSATILASSAGGRLPMPTASVRDRISAIDGSWVLNVDLRRVLPDVESAGEFLFPQFQEAAGESAALEVAKIENDPNLSGLAALALFADRNADLRLEETELQRYLHLVDRGLEAQLWVNLADRLRNPFPDLDRSRDNRWSYIELASAPLAFARERPTAVPRQVRLSFGATPVKSWGGMMIPTLGKRTLPAKDNRSGTLPKWFQAQDLNRDGIISPMEFKGSPSVLRKLDVDGNGWISNDEALVTPVQTPTG